MLCDAPPVGKVSVPPPRPSVLGVEVLARLAPVAVNEAPLLIVAITPPGSFSVPVMASGLAALTVPVAGVALKSAVATVGSRPPLAGPTITVPVLAAGRARVPLGRVLLKFTVPALTVVVATARLRRSCWCPRPC